MFSAIILSALSSFSFASVNAEVASLLQQRGGCFDVSYRFVEDGAHDKTIASSIEAIEVNVNGDTVTLQNWGVWDGGRTKHWGEQWNQGTDGLAMKVLGPSGLPRYFCHQVQKLDKSLMCSAQHAPKPVRDSARTDYDYLNRENTVHVTPSGWVQTEFNKKYKQDGTLVTTEVGWIEYKRIDDFNCQSSRK